MSFPEERVLTRQVTTLRAYVVAVGLVAAGLWLASLGMSNPPTWYQRVLNTIGNTLFALGAISLLYELALRRDIHRELVALIGMQGSLAETRILSAGKYPEVDWGLLLKERTRYAFLLLRPLPWIEANWHLLADSFAQAKCTCDFYLPEPDAPFIGALANHLDVPEEDYRAELRRAGNLIEDRWKAGIAEHRFRKGIIRIRSLESMPTYSIAIADNFAAIVLPSSGGRVGDEADYAVVYQGRADAYPISWFHTQLTGRQPGKPLYSDGEP